MPSELATALTALADRLAQLAVHYQGLHEELKTLALSLVSVTENCESPGVKHEVEHQPTSMSPADEEAPRDDEKATERLPILTLGSARRVVADGLAVKVSHRSGTTDEELGEIEARSRLKAEAMRWASTRRQLMKDGANFRDRISPGDRDLLLRANELPECHLWMCKPSFTVPDDLTLLEDAARWFDLVADALAIVRSVLGDSKVEKEFLGLSMEVLAQSQSALRVAVRRVSDRADRDQARVYEWLRSTVNRKQMSLKRYMRLDDPADPANLDEIKAILAGTKDRICGRQATNERKRACLSRLSYHAKLIGRHGANETDWRSIIEAVEAALRHGIPPSNVEIRDLLLPIIDLSPEGSDLPQGYRLVLREIRRCLESEDEDGDQLHISTDSEELDRAATFLGGKTVILLGGEPRVLYP